MIQEKGPSRPFRSQSTSSARSAPATVSSKADTEVAAAKAAAMIPTEKKPPIKVKDALGRKFSFPFEICRTGKGTYVMMTQAFEHVDSIGAIVADGNYDLVGPGGEIILPQIWEGVIQPGWQIKMHMPPSKEAPTEEKEKQLEPPPR